MCTTCSKLCTTCKRFFSANSQPSSVFTAQPQLMHGVRATLQNTGVLCESSCCTTSQLHKAAAHQGVLCESSCSYTTSQLHNAAAHQGAARPLRHPFVVGGNETSCCKAKLESDNQGEILSSHKKNMWSSLKERRRRRLIGRRRNRGEEGGGEGGGEGEGGDGCPCGGLEKRLCRQESLKAEPDVKCR